MDGAVSVSLLRSVGVKQRCCQHYISVIFATRLMHLRSIFVIVKRRRKKSKPIIDIPEGPTTDTLCENMEGLSLGLLSGQTSDNLVFWAAFNAVVLDFDGDHEISQINIFEDGLFRANILAQISTAGVVAVADDGIVVTWDYALSDLTTQRFYSLEDTITSIVMTRQIGPVGT